MMNRTLRTTLIGRSRKLESCRQTGFALAESFVGSVPWSNCDATNAALLAEAGALDDRPPARSIGGHDPRQPFRRGAGRLVTESQNLSRTSGICSALIIAAES